MSISVQNTSAALLALQTLAGQASAAGSSSSQGAAAAAAQSSANPLLSTTQSVSTELGALSAVSSSLDRAASISDSALAAGQSISDLLSQMKQAVETAQAGSSSASSSSAATANSGFSALVQQLSEVIASAGFDGANLIDGSQGGDLKVQTGADPSSTLTLSPQNMSLGGAIITVSQGATISTASSAASVLAQIDASITNVSSALNQIADQSTQIQAHAGFVAILSSAIGASSASSSQSGGDGLSADGARLMALQVQQQLGGQSSGIANAAPSMLLSLFK